MKKVIYLLALWFLLDWAFFNKIKPFIIAQFGLDTKQKTCDTTVVNTGDYTYGIDISHYEGKETSLPFNKNASISFVICKATEGSTSVDPKFNYNWNNINNINNRQKKKLIRGAYHFYINRDDPVLQANNFLKTVGSFPVDDFPPIVDVEDSLTNNEQFIRFLSIIQDSTNRTPVIYTNYDIGHRYLNDTAFAKYPLWFAFYSDNAPVTLPGAWKGQVWTLWQKSEHYYINSTANDFDVFNGTIDDLKKFIRSH